jgi:diadenosine tetraphosphate (Ap4A) HIT family hydrolase
MAIGVFDPSKDFVAEAAGEPAATQFSAIYEGDPPSRLLAASKHFAALVDLSPLCAGHVLLVTREYLPSFGGIPESQWEELLILVERVRVVVEGVYGHCVVVEHGSASHPAHSPCISHAHWHLIPIKVDYVRAMEVIGVEVEAIPEPSALADWATSDRPYLFVDEGDGRLFVGDPGSGFGLPRQFIRREAAAVLGEDDWDWALPPRRQVLRRTVEDLAPHLIEKEISGNGP